MTKSIISEDLTVTGDITGSGLIEVQGTVRGDIKSQAVDILNGGQVEGAVTADTAHVRGVLKGSLSADSVDLYADATVDADVSAGTMSSEKGARVVGKVDIGGGRATKS
ncbi:polymer-forming cytoskeletal protein [Ponticoccus sp. SC2-23]|uniref:bactofilin family protein n=1 Tax=Alexandriicola marinus TaxID=2081710 RepID=UPI0013E0E84F|nr:polymer-forming cytoskeletal protein [Alexandriicola marinus]MBM1220119.1 polymer-forming cytoskeletal protein [Ponticoccus sp. SC6-9]MBM1224805.1 polymer-forming cytoskeletal protein [Ponticoccus sp. SC6-15]MBM1228318.1 polymer-forming cytoskeletal protein [Ponticoccus sp. SC6-38]MBM1234044.1 polymer-forming cytoskeletal protein [Ponticoccus sp. SC6-45]MBM1238820.1 polymer-forming cytoskeletal protein [Ponticoccus sp. SC6-49]MBM1242601.1 polymer-forming cytoskeletal protein [Ponticoccus s